ncbi:hypothetical protein BJ138DRAFT_1118492 [Hygrophoropsis aurantiaca]|uniref:Uncharacterized protein n=1 Tax=Hygrophoropsis aurantiaca TaxID=72124 RepID=A0ACB7ZXJ9_9AGAM|nr:hypothetical protein BJ138DRAFT_1118492 [Hygrophoropsis aurantiaca]
MPPRPQFTHERFPCPHSGCNRILRNRSGLTQHRHSAHGYSFRPVNHQPIDVEPEPNPTPSSSPAPSITPDPLPACRNKYAVQIEEVEDVDGPNYTPDPDELRFDPTIEEHNDNDQEFDEDDSATGYNYIRDYHEDLTGHICDEHGTFIDSNTPPPPFSTKDPNDWAPYRNRLEFELAEFLYSRNQMSGGNIDKLMDMWGVNLAPHNAEPPFSNHKDLYKTIDATPLGDVPWKSFAIKYQGEKPSTNVPPWMDQSFEVWYRDPREVVRNMLANPDYNSEIDYAPYREFNKETSERRWSNFMSGEWANKQADEIALDPATHGAAFVPVILGSDKTTVSVATGQNDYYPLYASIGNVHNNVRRAHRNAVSVIAFLSIPKTSKAHANTNAYRKFKKQLYHSSISKCLETLKSAMTTPEVVRCGDGHFRRIIYGIGPYIADYEEQVYLGCIVRNWCARCTAPPTDLDSGGPSRSEEHTDALVNTWGLGVLWDQWGIVGDLVPFTNDFPRADIHELLAPDILHQLIKGTFKDHLVAWVEKFLEQEHSKEGAKAILDDIDRRIALAPPFSGLRRFPQGRGFSQWTGDDSKALMKVYLPAIEGHVHQDVVRTFRAFLEFCYIVRRNIIDESTLRELKDALDRFHTYRKIFTTIGMRLENISLPRQHSMTHYELLIRMFGAPNGLCSSITESKHIKAVKEPWRRSNRFHALGQMLLTNQRLDKIAASRVDFTARGMLSDTLATSYFNAQVRNDQESVHTSQNGDLDLENAQDVHNSDIEQHSCNHTNQGENGDDNDNDGMIDERVIDADVQMARTAQRKRTKTVPALADEIHVPELPQLISLFLYDQLFADDNHSSSDVSLADCPRYNDAVKVFNHATASFFAPSDPSGIHGMRREIIRASPMWRKEAPQYNCVFVSKNNNLPGMRGFEVARILCFFSFEFRHQSFPCALVHWFELVANEPDDDTGMWMVKPHRTVDGSRELAVIHIDCIYRATHLLPIFGQDFVPDNLKFHQTLDTFPGFYVNKFADHHAFELAA